MTDKQIVDTTKCAWKSFEGTYCPEVEQLLKRKEEKLEQYKKSKQASYEALQKKCNELELENRKLRELLKTLDDENSVYEISEIEFQKYLKLKQTLIEIRDIAIAIVYGTHFTDDIKEHFKELNKQILNKISEVIKDE